MKDHIRDIVGKTITGVIVAKKENDLPRHQVFLVFSDDTYFEFYGSDFCCAGGVDKGGYVAARDYAERSMKAKITAVYGEGEK